MKKYIAPEAAIVNLAAESNMAFMTISIVPGTKGEIGGSNFRYEEEWEEEEF